MTEANLLECVFVGGRMDGDTVMLRDLPPALMAPEPGTLTAVLDASVPFTEVGPQVVVYRQVLDSLGMPSMDDHGRYRYAVSRAAR